MRSGRRRRGARGGAGLGRSAGASPAAGQLALLHRQIIDELSDLVAVVDRRYAYVAANPAYCRAYLATPEGIAGRSVAQLVGDETFQSVIRPRLDRAFAGEPVAHQAWFELPGAGRRYLDVRYVPLRRAGRVEHVAVLASDVTERRLTEEERDRLLADASGRAAEPAAALEHTQLDATIRAIPDAVVIYAPTGEITHINPAAELILRSTYASFAREGTPLAVQLAQLRAQAPEGRPLPPEERPVARALRGESVSGVVMVLYPPGQSAGQARWVHASAAPIRAPDGRLLGAVAIYTDVTELRELQLRQEDLLRMVSHDLRGPLTVILGQAQILGRSAEQIESVRKGAEAIAASARRMNTMIQDLVDQGRLESGQLELSLAPVNLPGLARDLVARLGAAMPTQRIQVEAPEGLPSVLADPARLERVLTNLLSNALKYSDPGAPVTVRFTQRDGEVVVAVSDRGRGIAPEDLAHLFERYYRTREARGHQEGLGLGLYITQQLVRAHRGRLWVESEVGHGSTFSFTLPVAPSWGADPAPRWG